MFRATLHHDAYEPHANGTDHATYYQRLTACQSCPLRAGHKCTIADQLCSILARQPGEHCPQGRWPGETVLAREEAPARPAAPHQTLNTKHQTPTETHVGPFARPREIKNLAVITTHFNPCGYKKPRAHYDRFAEGIARAGVPLYTCELAFDDDPFTLPANDFTLQVRGTRARNNLFLKECLSNQLLRQKVPDDVDAVAWIDCDVLFPNPDWPARTRELLAHFEIVQLFRDLYNLHDDGRFELVGRSVGWKWTHDRKSAVSYAGAGACPGLAWAARFEPGGWLRTNGLRDDNIIGSGDVIQLWATTGARPWDKTLPEPWSQQIAAWATPIAAAIGGAIGYLPTDVLHLYHGSATNRKYRQRWLDLLAAGFNRDTDIERDANGLWSWTDLVLNEKPHLVELLNTYFASRKEDE